MELQEQITALEAEKKQQIAIIENLNLEKIALDQMLVDTLKQSLEWRKQMIVRDTRINELLQKMRELEVSLSSITKEKTDLQNSLSAMQSESNCGG